MLFGKYASKASEADYPSLWDGLLLLLGPTIQSPSKSVYDFSRYLEATNSQGTWSAIQGRPVITLGPATSSISLAMVGNRWNFGAGDFTFIGDYYFTATATYNTFFSFGNPISVNNGGGILLRRQAFFNDVGYIGGSAPAGSAQIGLNWSASFPLNTNLSVCFARKAGVVSMYSNGVLVYTATRAYNVSAAGNTLKIGNSIHSGSEPMTGSVGKFAIYNRCLLPGEILLYAKQPNAVFVPKSVRKIGSVLSARRRRILTGAT